MMMTLKKKKRNKLRILELYEPHPAQLKAHNWNARFKVLVWGRQSGKSTWGLNELAFRGWETPNQILWFVSPTNTQARQQYRRFVGMLWNCRGIIVKKNQTELRIRLSNGTTIFFKSGEVLENLRGETLHGVIVDEVREQHPDLWNIVLRPMLATTRGWAAFISTPNGFDHLYDFYCQAQADTTGEWWSYNVPSSSSPYWSAAELESIRSQMSEAQYAQEILAEFRDLTSGKAYYNYGPHNHRDFSPFSADPVEYVNFLPILVGMDFNLRPMAWILGQHHQQRIHYSEEQYLKDTNTPEAAQYLVEKLKRISRDWGVNLQNTGVILLGDATGKATQRTSNLSDYRVVCIALDKAGIRWVNKTPESNPGVKDRVTTANARFKSGTGEVCVTFNTKKCLNTHQDLQRTTWKHGETIELDEGPKKERTHGSDGATYPVAALLPLKSTKKISGVRVIVR